MSFDEARDFAELTSQLTPADCQYHTEVCYQKSTGRIEYVCGNCFNSLTRRYCNNHITIMLKAKITFQCRCGHSAAFINEMEHD